MNSRKLISVVLISLLFASILSSTQLVAITSAQGSDGSETPERRARLVFTVGPDGTVIVDVIYEGTPPEELFGIEGISMNGSVVFTENGAVSSIQIELPSEITSQFPFNSSTVSLLVDYLNDLLTANLNVTVELPEEVASQFPFNATDLTVSGEYSDGDLDVLIDGSMEINLTDILEPMLHMFVGFNQSFEFPIIAQLNYSKGEYEGLIVLHLLPGLPIGDLEINVVGNLTDIRFNGTATVVYGYYFDLPEINSAFMDNLEWYAENIFNASMETGGSLLNITEGRLNCTYINIERENTTMGEDVTFDVRIHGDFVRLLASQLRLPLPEMDNGDIVYNLLNDTLYKIQSASIDIAYTPTDTMLYFMLTGTLHLEDLVRQVSETITSDQWHLPIGEGPFYIDSWLLSINSTIHSVQTATVGLTYEREEGTVNLSLSFVMNAEEATSGITGSLEEVMWAFPPEIVEIIESLLTNKFAEIVSARYRLTYAKGFVNYTDEELYEGDINAQVNFMKPLLWQYWETASPNGLPWQAYYVNETLINITGLDLWLSMNETSMTLEFEGLTLQPPIDIVNATTFKLERFFNFTSGDPSRGLEPLELPGKNETLSVTIVGGSNSTHKIALYNATGVPQPNVVLKDALNRPILMTWNNVTLSSLKDIQFIIVPGTQTGEVIPEPEKVTPQKPVIVNATETLRVLINITGISDKVSLMVSNVTAPVGVEPPPGTWKVLGNYIQVAVSNEAVSVNATIRMYYTDQQVAQAGVAESSLKIYRWNGTDWVPIEPSYVNTQENYVWAYVNRFSIFALMGDMPPIAVTASVSNLMKKSLNLAWTQNIDPDFARYEVFRSTTQGVLGMSIANITNKATTNLPVSGLSPSTIYYFTVRVWDSVGLYTDSAQVVATMLAPPTAVTVSVSDISENSLKLTWTQSPDSFFAKYEVFRDGTSIANITVKTTTSWTVSGLTQGTTYNFRVRVVDSEGLYADSTPVSATTTLPLWQQPWFIGTIAAVIVVVAAAAAVLMKRKGPSGTS